MMSQLILLSSSFSKAWRMSMARLITAHHIGTVLESASGIFFPDRVESTRIMLLMLAIA